MANNFVLRIVEISLAIISVFTCGILADRYLLLGGLNKTSSDAVPTTISKKALINQVVFGKSVQGKDIKGYVIGDGQKCVLLFGTIHGNEMGSEALLERLVIEIEKNPGIVSTNVRLVVLPIANPDGFYERADKLNANGVNINLNFDTTGWQHYGPDYHEYAGSGPFSEPESQMIRKIVEDYNVSMMISYHSQGQLVIPENNAASYELGRWYANKSGYYYDDQSYNYFGTATRWFAENKNGKALTIELTDKMDSDWAINKEALVGLISEKDDLNERVIE